MDLCLYESNNCIGQILGKMMSNPRILMTGLFMVEFSLCDGYTKDFHFHFHFVNTKISSCSVRVVLTVLPRIIPLSSFVDCRENMKI